MGNLLFECELALLFLFSRALACWQVSLLLAGRQFGLIAHWLEGDPPWKFRHVDHLESDQLMWLSHLPFCEYLQDVLQKLGLPTGVPCYPRRWESPF
jgi:hypothetical protein